MKQPKQHTSKEPARSRLLSHLEGRLAHAWGAATAPGPDCLAPKQLLVLIEAGPTHPFFGLGMEHVTDCPYCSHGLRQMQADLAVMKEAKALLAAEQSVVTVVVGVAKKAGKRVLRELERRGEQVRRRLPRWPRPWERLLPAAAARAAPGLLPAEEVRGRQLELRPVGFPEFSVLVQVFRHERGYDLTLILVTAGKPSPVEGCEVRLLKDGEQLDRTRTFEEGMVEFKGLEPGSYGFAFGSFPQARLELVLEEAQDE